jgi:hypothetical protein
MDTKALSTISAAGPEMNELQMKALEAFFGDSLKLHQLI